MSAPAVTRTRVAVRVPPSPVPLVPADPQGPWPATISALCDQFGDVCRSAVDPLEIASALEFQGLGDQAAKERYGCADVFDLAAAMYLEVPRCPAEPEVPADPWQSSRLRPAVHMLLYGVPAVCFMAVAGIFHGLGVLTVLITALVVGWSLAQGLAYLGYLRLGQAGITQARSTLRIGLGATVLVAIATMLVAGIVARARMPVVAFGVGEAAYMLGASVLMVLGDELWMLAALAPGVAGGGAFLAEGRPRTLEPLVWVALAATALASVAFALLRTRHAEEPVGRHLSADDLPGLVAATGFGLFAAGLLAFPSAVAVYGHGRVSPGTLLAILPLSLSMGVAEWSLLWYRRRTQSLLRSNTQIRVFAWQARLALADAVLQYVGAAAALTVAAAVIARSAGLLAVSSTDAPQVFAYLMLGTAMFLALTLQALGIRIFTVAAFGVALAAEFALHSFGLLAQFVACGGLLIAMGGYAFVMLARAVRHVY